MRVRSTLTVGLVAAAMTVATTTPAHASVQTPYLWRNSTGRFGVSCGVSSGGQVKAIQAMLWAGHFYVRTIGGTMETTKSQVDGVFGTRTANALKVFQREHGLVADGCAGAATLDTFQWHLVPYGTEITSQAKYYSGARTWAEGAGGYPEIIGFYYYAMGNTGAEGLWRFQWFDACWYMQAPIVYAGRTC